MINTHAQFLTVQIFDECKNTQYVMTHKLRAKLNPSRNGSQDQLDAECDTAPFVAVTELLTDEIDDMSEALDKSVAKL